MQFLFTAKRASRLLTAGPGSVPIDPNFLFNSGNAARVNRIVIIILIDHNDVAIIKLSVKIAAVLNSVCSRSFSGRFFELWRRDCRCPGLL